MNRKSFLIASAITFFQFFNMPTYAQVQMDSVKDLLKKQADTLNNKIEKVNADKIVLAKKVDTLKQNDSIANNAIGTSFSNALKVAIKKPETLYNKSFNKYWYISILTFIFLILFLYKSFWYAKNSALCKDDSYYDDNGQMVLKPYNLRTYSYSRVQLFWWTIIIVSCYSIFYALYGVLLPLNPSVVLLIGSGLAVFIIGKTIDINQIENNNKGTDKPNRHQDIHKSNGLLNDILSDENGISIHRLQAVAFNVIYGIGFIGYFIANINASPPQYPLMQFEEWQLALLGVSAAGYLGLKTSENSNATKPARDTEAGNKPNPPGGSPAEGGGAINIPDDKDGKVPVNATPSNVDIAAAEKIARDEKNYQ